MKLLWPVILLFGLVLSGCADSAVPVVLSGVNQSGDIVTTVANATSVASVEKERMLMDAFKNRDVQRAMMYQTSGFNMKWEGKSVTTTTTVVVEGKPITIEVTTTEFLPVVAYKEEPEFDQPLPDEPSRHPVWSATTDIVGIVAKYGLIGWGISEFSGLLQKGYDSSGDTYNGDALLINSKNNAYYSQQEFMTDNPLQKSIGGGADCPPGIPCSCETWLSTGGTCVQ